MKAKTKQICKKAFVWAFYLLVLVFIVLYFRDIDWGAIKNVEIAWGFMAVSFAVRMAGLLLQPLAWNLQLKPYGNALPAKKLYSIYAQSWIGRYIPGKVAWVGGKIYFAAQEGVDKNVAVITSFLDSMLQVIGSLLVAAVFFLVIQRAPGVDDSLIYLTYALTAALLLCLVPRVFNFLVNLVHKVLRRTAIDEIPHGRRAHLAQHGGGCGRKNSLGHGGCHHRAVRIRQGLFRRFPLCSCGQLRGHGHRHGGALRSGWAGRQGEFAGGTAGGGVPPGGSAGGGDAGQPAVYSGRPGLLCRRAPDSRLWQKEKAGGVRARAVQGQGLWVNMGASPHTP